MQNSIAKLVLASTALIAGKSLCCPAFLEAHALDEPMLKSSPAKLRLFAIKTDQPNSIWHEIDLQIDPLNESGVLDTKRLGEAFNSISPLDRLVLPTDKFGPRAQPHSLTSAPCNGESIVEIESLDRSEDRRFAYLTACEGAPAGTSRVIHNKAEQRISTDLFDYHYLPSNQLLFRTLAVNLGSQERVIASRDSDFQLHLDLRRFFTLDFTNKDVESYVEATHSGSVGVSGLINFYLRLLMFKINLKLATLASFYESSANIPMIVDVPVKADRHLNAGSGMFYSFKPEHTKLEFTGYPMAMPQATAELIKTGPQGLAEAGLRNCQDGRCIYRLQGLVRTKKFALDIEVPRSAVAEGFFPMIASDAATFKESMGWKLAKEDLGRVGFYYENTGLSEGRFKMDYWIRFVDLDGSGGTCPAPIKVGKTIPGTKISH